jgi:hypothetical protein
MSTTTTSSSSVHRQIWEAYVASWKTTSPTERHSLFAKSLTSDCEYRDPLVIAKGWQALEAYMNQFHQQVPGGYFVTTRFSQHNDRSLANWTMRDASGQVIGEGASYGQYSPDGQLLAMTGFFEAP